MLHLIHTPDAYESHKDMRNVTPDLRGNLQVVDADACQFRV
jgi:hypothetical protein